MLLFRACLRALPRIRRSADFVFGIVLLRLVQSAKRYPTRRYCQRLCSSAKARIGIQSDSRFAFTRRGTVRKRRFLIKPTCVCIKPSGGGTFGSHLCIASAVAPWLL